MKSTPVSGVKVIAKEDALAEAKRNYGYFALLCNGVKDAVEALEIYRNKDLVEKAFDNLKEGLNMRRVAVSSEQSLDGKLLLNSLLSFIYLALQRRCRMLIFLRTTHCREFWMNSMLFTVLKYLDRGFKSAK